MTGRPYIDVLYTLGLDLGQVNDYTALCVLETQTYVAPAVADDWRWPELTTGWHAPTDLTPGILRLALAEDQSRWPGRPPLALRHLERLRGVPYPRIVRMVGDLVQRSPLAGNCHLVIDATGVGRGVCDLFWEAGLWPVEVSIHGGDRVTSQGNAFRVPKRDLVSATQQGLQTGRLVIAAGIPHAETLRRELETFKFKIAPLTAHDSYGVWREADHDDLVLAVALGAWWRDHWWRDVDHERMTRKPQTYRDENVDARGGYRCPRP